jgi:hypothetical protein
MMGTEISSSLRISLRTGWDIRFLLRLTATDFYKFVPWEALVLCLGMFLFTQ